MTLLHEPGIRESPKSLRFSSDGRSRGDTDRATRARRGADRAPGDGAAGARLGVCRPGGPRGFEDVDPSDASPTLGGQHSEHPRSAPRAGTDRQGARVRGPLPHRARAAGLRGGAAGGDGPRLPSASASGSGSGRCGCGGDAPAGVPPALRAHAAARLRRGATSRAAATSLHPSGGRQRRPGAGRAGHRERRRDPAVDCSGRAPRSPRARADRRNSGRTDPGADARGAPFAARARANRAARRGGPADASGLGAGIGCLRGRWVRARIW